MATERAYELINGERGVAESVVSDHHHAETVGYFSSPSLNEFFAALAKATTQFKPVLKQNTNPFFKSKYADLGTVIEATKEALSKNGLALVQFPGVDGTAAVITSILGHSSGQYMGCVLKMPVSKGDAQGIGSAITYARRYAYQALVGVAAEEDDDANSAVTQPFQKPAPKPKVEAKPFNPSDGMIDGAQRNKLWATAKKKGLDENQMRDFLGKMGYEHTSEIPVSKFDSIIKEIETLA